jgi:ubiquinol-cytochrome c reductase iron-sulfur subunit
MNPTVPITCPSVHATAHDPDKRQWLIATGAAGGAAALAAAIPFVSTFAPSERARAAGGPVEVDISDIPPGGREDRGVARQTRLGGAPHARDAGRAARP